MDNPDKLRGHYLRGTDKDAPLDPVEHSKRDRAWNADICTQQYISLNLPRLDQLLFQVALQPSVAKAYGSPDDRERARNRSRKPADWPVEPPLVAWLGGSDSKGLPRPNQFLASSSNYFVYADLCAAGTNPRRVGPEELQGQRVASLTKIDKMNPVNNRGYFAFPDLHVERPGKYYFKLSLMENVIDPETGNMFSQFLESTDTYVFTVIGRSAQLPPAPSRADIPQLIRDLQCSGLKMKLRTQCRPRQQRNDHDWATTDMLAHVARGAEEEIMLGGERVERRVRSPRSRARRSTQPAVSSTMAPIDQPIVPAYSGGDQVPGQLVVATYPGGSHISGQSVGPTYSAGSHVPAPYSNNMSTNFNPQQGFHFDQPAFMTGPLQLQDQYIPNAFSMTLDPELNTQQSWAGPYPYQHV